MSSSEVKTIKAISEARASFLIDNLDVSENIIYNIVNNIDKNENAERLRRNNKALRKTPSPLARPCNRRLGQVGHRQP